MRNIAGIMAAVMVLGTVGIAPTPVLAAESVRTAECSETEGLGSSESDPVWDIPLGTEEDTDRQVELPRVKMVAGPKAVKSAEKALTEETAEDTAVSGEKEKTESVEAAETAAGGEEPKTAESIETSGTTETPGPTETTVSSESTETTETPGPTESTETPEPVSLTVTAAQIEKKGTKKAIQAALDTARDKATEASPYTVTVEPGEYTIPGENILRLYSYTTLVLSGVTIVRMTAQNMIKLGDTDAKDAANGATGYYYKNIKIIGGTLDGNYKDGTMLKIGHAENFVMENVSLKRCMGGHLFEAAGVSNMTLKGCHFSDQLINSDGSGFEAVQLDILCHEHFSKYRTEALANQNILIEGCTFDNVPRGVGSHTSILNLPMDGITIQGCSFENITEAGIRGLNWKNCKITGNTMVNAVRGIILYSVFEGGKGMYLPSTLAEEGGVAATVPDTLTEANVNSGYEITGNKIGILNRVISGVSYIRSAITVCGGELTVSEKRDDGSGGLPWGDSYISGVTLMGNTITSPSCYGVRFMDVRSADCGGNTITATAISGGSSIYYGIGITENSLGVTLTGNVVQGAVTNGIYISGSQIAAVTGNRVSASGADGVKVNASLVSSFEGNRVENSVLYGVHLTGKASVNTFKSNYMVGNKLGAYYKDSDCSFSGISGNTICAPPEVTGVSCVAKGLYITCQKVTGADKYRFYRVESGALKKLTTTKNCYYTDKKVTSGKKYTYAVKVIKDSKVSSAATAKPVTGLFLAAPKLKSVTRLSSKKLQVKWSKVSAAKGYQIAYGRKKNFKGAKTKTIKKKKTVKTTLGKLTANKKYYVRIRSYKGSGKNRVYSGWSTVMVK